MSIGISDLAYSVRKNSVTAGVPIPLGHAQQLIAAAFGYKSLAAYQAAQAAAQEPQYLDDVEHVVLDHDLLNQRAGELRTAPTSDQLHALIAKAVKERAPFACLHESSIDFETYLREHVDQVIIEDEGVNGVLVNANYDGVDEVYFDFEVDFDITPVGSSLYVDLDGHVSLSIDTERLYAGHIVNIKGTLSVERLGLQCFGLVDCQVIKAKLDTSWRDDDGEPRSRSESEAYAELLGLELHEVDGLVDVEAEVLDGSSGDMVYGYILDFTNYASPEIAKKILQHHSSLRIEVGPDFFDHVCSSDWPR